MIKNFIFFIILQLHLSYGIEFSIDTKDEKWVISKNLTSVNTVYLHARDSIYRNSSFASWIKKNHLSSLRFGGKNWENPSGRNGVNPLDPAFDGRRENPANWMSLKEHLIFLKKAGIQQPLINIDHVSWNKYKLSEQESIDRAIRKIKYINSHGFRGGIYQVGNEDNYEFLPSAKMSRLQQAQASFAKHAAAIKEVDPTSITIYNQNKVSPSSLKGWIRSIAGPLVDGVEFHGKWPNGSKPPPKPVSIDKWLNEFPLRSRDRKYIWREMPARLRQAAAEAGKPNFLIMNIEWGANGNQHKTYDKSWNKFTLSLMLTDFLQEHFIGGYDGASFWSMNKTNDTRFLAKNDRKNPIHFAFSMLGEIQGGMMLDLKAKAGKTPFVYGFAAKKDKDVYLYLINKSRTPQALQLTVSGHKMQRRSPQGLSLVDTPDHWGKTQQLRVSLHDKVFSATLPALSYNRIKMARDLGDRRPPAAPKQLSAQASRGKIILNWADNSDADLASYRIYKGGSVGGPYRLLASNVSDSNYVDTDTIIRGCSYHYVIQAVDKDDNASPYSVETSVGGQ